VSTGIGSTKREQQRQPASRQHGVSYGRLPRMRSDDIYNG